MLACLASLLVAQGNLAMHMATAFLALIVVGSHCAYLSQPLLLARRATPRRASSINAQFQLPTAKTRRGLEGLDPEQAEAFSELVQSDKFIATEMASADAEYWER